MKNAKKDRITRLLLDNFEKITIPVLDNYKKNIFRIKFLFPSTGSNFSKKVIF